MPTLTFDADKPVIVVPLEEWEAIQDTLEIMSDPELVADIRQGMKDIAEGRTRKLSDLRAERRARNGH